MRTATALPARCITTRQSIPTLTRRIITLTAMRRKILPITTDTRIPTPIRCTPTTQIFTIQTKPNITTTKHPIATKRRRRIIHMRTNMQFMAVLAPSIAPINIIPRIGTPITRMMATIIRQYQTALQNPYYITHMLTATTKPAAGQLTPTSTFPGRTTGLFLCSAAARKSTPTSTPQAAAEATTPTSTAPAAVGQAMPTSIYPAAGPQPTATATVQAAAGQDMAIDTARNTGMLDLLL